MWARDWTLGYAAVVALPFHIFGFEVHKSGYTLE